MRRILFVVFALSMVSSQSVIAQNPVDPFSLLEPNQEQEPNSNLNNSDNTVSETTAEDLEAETKENDSADNVDANTNEEPDPNAIMFEEATQEMFPMSPEQIEVFRKMFESNHNAMVDPVIPDPTPRSRSIDLNLDPGSPPPVINMVGNNVSTLTFSDLTGQPWPVLSVTTGNPNAFSVSTAGDQGTSNIIVISPTIEVTTSNLVVTLVDHPVPIILTVKSGREEVDYRVDLRLSERGPNASYDIVNAQSLPPTGDSVMLAFLDGVPPEGAKKLQSSRSNVEVYQYDDMYYVRTEMDLLSPAYLAKSSNVSSLNVYTLMDTPVLILSDDGSMVTVSVAD